MPRRDGYEMPVIFDHPNAPAACPVCLKPCGLQPGQSGLDSVNDPGLAANDRKAPGIEIGQCGIADDGNLGFADPIRVVRQSPSRSVGPKETQHTNRVSGQKEASLHEP